MMPKNVSMISIHRLAKKKKFLKNLNFMIFFYFNSPFTNPFVFLNFQIMILAWFHYFQLKYLENNLHDISVKVSM